MIQLANDIAAFVPRGAGRPWAQNDVFDLPRTLPVTGSRCWLSVVVQTLRGGNVIADNSPADRGASATNRSSQYGGAK